MEVISANMKTVSLLQFLIHVWLISTHIVLLSWDSFSVDRFKPKPNQTTMTGGDKNVSTQASCTGRAISNVSHERATREKRAACL